jgi:hypothetical protein
MKHTLFLALALGLLPAALLHAEEPTKGARILMVTQSAGFKHGSVSRKSGKVAASLFGRSRNAQRAAIQIGSRRSR